jgi:hypothetical protein
MSAQGGEGAHEYQQQGVPWPASWPALAAEPPPSLGAHRLAAHLKPCLQNGYSPISPLPQGCNSCTHALEVRFLTTRLLADLGGGAGGRRHTARSRPPAGALASGALGHQGKAGVAGAGRHVQPVPGQVCMHACMNTLPRTLCASDHACVGSNPGVCVLELGGMPHACTQYQSRSGVARTTLAGHGTSARRLDTGRLHTCAPGAVDAELRAEQGSQVQDRGGGVDGS